MGRSAPISTRTEAPSALTSNTEAHTPRVCAGGEQQRHRHRIEHGDKRQSEQPDRSLKVGGRRPISSARYRTGPTSASARLRWASILAFSICRPASAWPRAGAPQRCRRDRGASGRRSSSHRRGGQAVSIPRWLRRSGRCADRGRRRSGPGWRDGPRRRPFCPRAPDRRPPYDRGGRE